MSYDLRFMLRYRPDLDDRTDLDERTGMDHPTAATRSPMPVAWLLGALLFTAGCEVARRPASDPEPEAGRPSTEHTATSPSAAANSIAIPPRMQACAECHLNTVEAYLGHGMSGSLSPISPSLGSAADGGPVELGQVDNPFTGAHYEIADSPKGLTLSATLANGALRTQRLVGRIGAGRFDVSFAGEEIDPFDGRATGRLFFAPLEQVTGHGLELAPFDLYPRSTGLDMALTYSCLTCHTLDPLAELPQAANATGGGRSIFPGNALGGNAFEHLQALGCEACHGAVEKHVAIMRSELSASIDDLGLVRLGDRAPAEQRDRCARCHLQGEFRIELFKGTPNFERPLAAQLPTLIHRPVTQPSDDYRFVGQLERLALSACFKQTPSMTCSSCHDPHRSVQSQGLESFEASCRSCHDCDRPPETQVTAITGETARSEAGCVDCHVRRSQPFDLPHVRTADHFVRRHIPLPNDALPHRAFTDPAGSFQLFDQQRLQPALDTPAGQRWRDGVLAMGLLTAGRVPESAALFDRFPTAGTEEARTPSAPTELMSLEVHSDFHQMRALALLGSGRIEEALAAYGDALEIDPLNSGARLERARVLLDLGNVPGALIDTEAVIRTHPEAEQPWQLRAELALRVGRTELALEALQKTVDRWPSDGSSWQRLGQVHQQLGNAAASRVAFARAAALGAAPR